MKRKCFMLLLAVTVAMGICGCNSSAVKEESSDVKSEPIEVSADAGETESIEIDSFTFEGQEYSFPMDYSVIEDAGWEVSETMYELFENDTDANTSGLVMENSNYPGIVMDVYATDAKGEDTLCDSVADLVQEIENTGIYSMDIYADDPTMEGLVYPEFDFGGVSFGSSLEDITEVFGEPELFLDSEYVYFSQKDINYEIMLDLEDDAVYCMGIFVCPEEEDE